MIVNRIFLRRSGTRKMFRSRDSMERRPPGSLRGRG